MISSVSFISQREAESRIFRPNEVVVSITDIGQGIANISGARDTLRLEFMDLVEPKLPRYDSTYLFSQTHADRTIRFLDIHHQSPDSVNVVVHCGAGVSRSAAIALFIESITGCDFPSRSNASLPNKLVVDVFSALSGVSIDIPEGKFSCGGIALLDVGNIF